MRKRIQKIKIEPSASVLEALKLMDEARVKALLVFDDDTFIELLTIGDIQRAIIHNVKLSSPVCSIINNNKDYAQVGDSRELIQEQMLRMRSECMPIIDNDGNLSDVVFWDEVFGKEIKLRRDKMNLPVVIMAGGLGTRLKPITNVIPKPLVPIGEKTILEEILDRFESLGCNKFYLSVNYKFDIIKFYLNQLQHHYNINFIKEDKPLGTIGSVSLLKGKITTPFFVSNCDIVIDQDYRDVYDYHHENGNDITIVTAVKSYKIPYGVIETGENGLMTKLTEKPEKTYMINTGVYILQPELIDEIPQGAFFHITDLMEKVKSKGGKVGCFPIGEKAWTDMGDWDEYLKLVRK